MRLRFRIKAVWPSFGSQHSASQGAFFCGIHVQVSDFGLSVLLETDQAYATTQQRGTLGYCGPEVLSGNQLSLETDVYSFGVILWEMYTAATPYDGMNEMQIVLHKVSA